MIGSIIANSKLDKYYDTISPDKKYAGYDTTNHRSIYKDDMDSYINNNTSRRACQGRTHGRII